MVSSDSVWTESWTRHCFIDGSCVSQGTEGFAAHDEVNLEAPVGRDLAIKDEARLRLGHPNAALVYRSSIGSPHRLKLG